jgi:hypothetical protein
MARLWSIGLISKFAYAPRSRSKDRFGLPSAHPVWRMLIEEQSDPLGGQARALVPLDDLILGIARRLCKVILFGERSLRRALSEYVEHYHAERNHQGKGNVLLFPQSANTRRDGHVRCRGRLGGLLRYYHQEAA